MQTILTATVLILTRQKCTVDYRSSLPDNNAIDAGLSIESIGTVERPYNKGPKDWQNCSLYRGLRYIEVCCIEVQLYLPGEENIIRVISDNILLFSLTISFLLLKAT